MSSEKSTPSTEQLARQVTEYTQQQPEYKLYATALKRVLEQACKSAFPEAFVQTREKAIASFAEKVVRRYDKYPDAINQLTDLCGGRIIVQTITQVQAVRRFIENSFTIRESDEKGLQLGSDRFGYRDMHYIVQLPLKSPNLSDASCSQNNLENEVDLERALALGFTEEEVQKIGTRRAELQVRTWVQHAWADILHDRMYKTPLKYPAEFSREGNLLAAIMEDGDRAFDSLTNKIDAMLVNYNAYADEQEVQRELQVQELILAHASEKGKPAIALRIARLLTPRGDFKGAVEYLEPYKTEPAPLGCIIRLELGNALCRDNGTKTTSAEFFEGQKLLEKVAEECVCTNFTTVPDQRRLNNLFARANAALAWSYDQIDNKEKARKCYSKALEMEPDNPYYLAETVCYEINCARHRDFLAPMLTVIRKGLATCWQHIKNNTEMPYAAFTAGRLSLLLDQPAEQGQALGFYARGIRELLNHATSMPADLLTIEKKWIERLEEPYKPKGESLWVYDLLELAERIRNMKKPESASPSAPVLIISGGASTLTPHQAERLTPMLHSAFKGFSGTIICGGTKVGVPGCVGAAAQLCGARGQRSFKLKGYLPEKRTDDAPKDERYDDLILCPQSDFNAMQVLRYWQDIINDGNHPATVHLLGFGGGNLSALEYRIALGLGATVGVVSGSGRAVNELLADEVWYKQPNLLPIPCDSATLRAFFRPPRANPLLDDSTLDKMGEALHQSYVESSQHKLPDNMKEWKYLPETFRIANLEQAKYAVQILEASGFEVRHSDNPVEFKPEDFSAYELESMAELEHGRWNIERLRDGWRPGPRDDQHKFHNNIVPWSDDKTLTGEIKDYDRKAIRNFPAILKKAGLEIHRARQ